MKAPSIAAIAFIVFLGPLNNAFGQPDPTAVVGGEPPEWLVWREFHASLEFYEKQSPGAIIELLKNRIALADAKTFAFMNAGRAYLQRLDVIDREARAEIAIRYKEQLAPKVPTPSGAADPKDLLRTDAGEPTGELLPGTARDGRILLNILRSDGFLNEVEAKRGAVLDRHLDTLNRSFGSDVLVKVQVWIASEVAPKILVGSEDYSDARLRDSTFVDHAPASR